MKNKGKKTLVVILGLAVLLAGVSSAAYAESLPTTNQHEHPMFSLEKRTVRSQTNRYQEYRIDIYPDRAVVFRGIWNTRILGEAKGEISERKFFAIWQGFTDIRFFDLEPRYGWELRDKSMAHEGESEYTLIFHRGETHKQVTVSNVVPDGTPPGIRLLIDRIKQLSGAHEWACPAEAQAFPPHGKPQDVCEFHE